MKTTTTTEHIEKKGAQRPNLFSLPVCSVVVFVCLARSLYAEEPWGKDADLINLCPKISIPELPKCPTPLLGAFGELMIKFHQDIISPCDGPRSHFKPSSSQYTLNAMRKYGFYIGMTMGCDRLMRENNDEWIYRYTIDGAGKPIKYDPVP